MLPMLRTNATLKRTVVEKTRKSRVLDGERELTPVAQPAEAAKDPPWYTSTANRGNPLQNVWLNLGNHDKRESVVYQTTTAT